MRSLSLLAARQRGNALILLVLLALCQPVAPFLVPATLNELSRPKHCISQLQSFSVAEQAWRRLSLGGKSSPRPQVAVESSRISMSESAQAGLAPREPIGRITSLDRSKISAVPDTEYYAAPRLVTHADDSWISRLTELYRERIPREAVVLDLMGSHVSHLPDDLQLSRLDVHGMNMAELRQNPAVQSTGGSCFLHDLNAEPALPFVPEDASYDVVLCALGVQYLEEPERVFAEVGRVLKPSGVVVVSFSSNLFYEKALTGWIERGMRGRSRLVKDYLRAAGGFVDIEEIGAEGRDGVLGTLASILPGGSAGDPFGAVVGVRSEDDADVEGAE